MEQELAHQHQIFLSASLSSLLDWSVCALFLRPCVCGVLYVQLEYRLLDYYAQAHLKVLRMCKMRDQGLGLQAEKNLAQTNQPVLAVVARFQ